MDSLTATRAAFLNVHPQMSVYELSMDHKEFGETFNCMTLLQLTIDACRGLRLLSPALCGYGSAALIHIKGYQGQHHFLHNPSILRCLTTSVSGFFRFKRTKLLKY